MRKGQKIFGALVAIAILALLAVQGIAWQEQLKIHQDRIDYWQITIPQMAEQFADVDEGRYNPLDAETGIAQENDRLAAQQKIILIKCVYILLLALLAGLLVGFSPRIASWMRRQQDTYYAKRGKESPHQKASRLKKEKHYHPPKGRK